VPDEGAVAGAVELTSTPWRVAVAGARGFIGTAACAALRAAGHTVVTIGRSGAVDVEWDPAEERFDADVLRGVDAVLNVTGEPIDQRWSDSTRQRIVDSRVIPTGLLARSTAAVSPQPRVLVNMSAIGYYGSRGDEVLDEHSSRGTGFLADVVAAWEEAAQPARDAGIRVVHPRFGLPLSPRGGVLGRLLPIFRLGGGGRIGDGRQWMSWIALTDAVRALLWLITRSSLAGPVNVAAPIAVRNEEFTRVLARVLRRPAVAAVPAFAIRLAFGQMGEETVLASQHVRPARLLADGFTFEQPGLEAALVAELNER
jgi:uncharacterized protein (TIGR01777 family)